jgi:hypothetical protein
LYRGCAPFNVVLIDYCVCHNATASGSTNRLIAGDSLLVMNSLLEKEGMAGQVQMVYMKAVRLDYSKNYITMAFLEAHYPFIATEIKRQGVEDTIKGTILSQPSQSSPFFVETCLVLSSSS